MMAKYISATYFVEALNKSEIAPLVPSREKLFVRYTVSQRVINFSSNPCERK